MIIFHIFKCRVKYSKDKGLASKKKNGVEEAEEVQPTVLPTAVTKKQNFAQPAEINKNLKNAQKLALEDEAKNQAPAAQLVTKSKGQTKSKNGGVVKASRKSERKTK